MAIADLIFNCGCGRVFKTIEEAVKHSDDHKHTLTVFGTVRSTERKVRKATAPSSMHVRSRLRVAETALAAVPVKAQVEDVGFSNLRARLRKAKE